MTAIHADMTVHVDERTTPMVYVDPVGDTAILFSTDNDTCWIRGNRDDIDRVLLSIVQQLDALRAKS